MIETYPQPLTTSAVYGNAAAATTAKAPADAATRKFSLPTRHPPKQSNLFLVWNVK